MARVIRVGVVGGTGRMGREVCRTVEEAPDLALAAIIDPAVEGHSLPDDWMPGVGSRAVVSSSVEGLADAGVDVAVDFTVADAARRTLPWLAEHGVHAVVGTTGLGPEDLASLRRVFSDGRANAVVSPNFAIGAVLLMRFCELAAPFMDGAEVVELHHDAKRDAPSGTALRTAERIAAAREHAGASAFLDHTTELALDGARGGSGPGGVRVHSVRLPGLVAHEEVMFGALGQSLTLRHDSYDRRSFMPGVLLAIRRVGDLPGVTLGLDALLGI
ncbi:MAG: 4-hydroxy-tetrahydrodipicolinate reductase [Actinomycetota bacterium]|nr:4-hydroxy-tetrahydrodipicolinate reductase [Actinomycetota bacterium]